MKIQNFSNTNHPIFAKGFTFVELQPIHLWRFFHIWQLLLFTTPQSSFFATTTPVKKKSKNYSQLVLHSKKKSKNFEGKSVNCAFSPNFSTMCEGLFSKHSYRVVSRRKAVQGLFWNLLGNWPFKGRLKVAAASTSVEILQLICERWTQRKLERNSLLCY